jgi:adenylyl- and sulfurtransferase ThiI
MGKSRADLTASLVEACRRRGIEVKTVVVPRTPGDEQREREVSEYLANLKRFEEASRRVNFVVGGDNCGYCRRTREMRGRY